MNKQDTIHKIAFWIINLLELLSIFNLIEKFNGEFNNSTTDLILSILIFICTTIVYISWKELFARIFKD